MSREPTKYWGIRLSVARKGFILVWLPMCAQLVALAFSGYWLVKEFNAIETHYSKRYLQEKVSVLHLISLRLSATMAQSALRPESDQIGVKTVQDGTKQLEEARAEIAKLPGSKEFDVGVIDREAKVLIASASEFARNPGQDRVRALSLFDESSRRLERDVNRFEQAMQFESSTVPEDPDSLKRTALHILLLIGAMTGGNILLAMLMGTWFSEGITSRVKLMIENTFRLSRSQALHPRLPGNDEIAYLDRVFHDMANAIAEAARKERAVIKHAADVICSIGADGRFTAVSPASLQVWGYRPEELIGRQFTEIVVREDRDFTNTSFKHLAEQGPEPQPLENRVVRKDGQIVHILWSAFWAPSEQSLFCVAHDITDRKQAEDQLRVSEARTRSIFESAPVALLVLDPSGAINVINPKAEQLFGCVAGDLLGRHVSVLLPGSKDLRREKFSDGSCKNIIGRVTPLEAHSLTGRAFPVELTFEHYAAGDGGEGYLAAILDVTERHEVDRLKREFVSTVSHELRTPLTSIRGSLTLLSVGALGQLSDQADKVVKIAERNSLRLISLINDLLDIEKLESGKLDMILEEASLQSVIERAVDAVRGFGEQYGIAVEYDRTESRVLADCDRLVQVLVNLLSNAIKYSPRESTVTITIREKPATLQVRVTDCGRGIPQEFCDRVFERFQQVEPEDSKRRGGTGLGLAICRAIIEQHNGTIGVESEEGRGSTFWFEIPIAGSAAAQAVQSQAASRRPSPACNE